MRRAAELLGGSHRVAVSASGCFQLVCLFLNGRVPTWATSSSLLGESSSRGIALSSIERPMCFSSSCASLAAPTSPKVLVACGPVDLATLEAAARYCARKAIGERRSVGVTSNPPSFLGGSIFFMENVLKSVLSQNQASKASAISLGQRNSQRTRHCSKHGVTSFQTRAWRLHSRSASHIRLILSARIRAFCNLSLVGS